MLMERAALQCVNAIKDANYDMDLTLVVCGSGNNGGDGFAIARMLYCENYKVDVVFAGRMESRSEETRQQMEILEKLGCEILTEIPDRKYDVVLDAIFGIGLCREIQGRYLDVINKMNSLTGYKVAVDIASGVSADTGNILGTAFKADLTVTFAWGKIGQYLTPGSLYSGKVLVKDIGITEPDWNRENLHYILEEDDLKELMPQRKPDSNKGTYGKLLIIAGSKGMSGAAYLSAKAAYKTGAGLVRIYTEESNRIILQQLLPEAIITTYESDKEDCFDNLQEMINWADNICIGCGLGTGDKSLELIRKFLHMNNKPCVIDADGLNNISCLSEEDKALLNKEGTSYILTPHMKEMSRICGHSVGELKNARTTLAKEFIEKYNVICVLKDSRTIVAENNRAVYINITGNSAMAKAGSGDVLAGVIAGLLSQGVMPYNAAVTGVFLHGLSGDAARRNCGSYSVLAEDLLKGIGDTLKSMEAHY